MDDVSDNDSVSSKLVIDVDCIISEQEKLISINSLFCSKRRSALLSSFKLKGMVNNNAELFSNSSIRVGRDYQVSAVPSVSVQRPKIYYKDKIIREQLLWKPNQLKQNELKLYLKKYGIKCGYQISKAADDEDALFLLMKNHFNVERSLVQLAMNSNSVKISREPRKLSVAECKEFESSFCKHSKKFRSYLESGESLKNRKLWEVVFFYYVWKKSHRYPLFVLKNKRSYKELPLSMVDHMQFLLKESFFVENNLIRK